ncbi:MAG: FtsX-like permease family protein [Candidatus Brocadiae bacterium]|nr:FtsX-like permease family protein [Candidatus Brocadiia bacterium]
MSALPLILQEIWHRKLDFLLGLLAVTITVALFVALLTMSGASDRETKRLMRDMGFNLLIVPKDTDMEDFWARDFAQEEMPEDYVHRLAGSGDIHADHYVAILQKKIEWRGRQILLTGWLPEVPSARRTREKSFMGLGVPPGRACVGYELARGLNIQRGDEIELHGKSLLVDAVLAEAGSKDDIRLYTHLHDAQEILNKPGKINMIRALGCLCGQGGRLWSIRPQIAEVLPDTRVTEFRSIAVARAETRRMVERQAVLILSTVAIACVIWVAVLSLLNVWERRQEIGILRALGAGSGKIAVLFLGRAVSVGLGGAVLGFIIGTGLALHFGPTIFKVTAAAIKPVYALMAQSLVAAPLVALLASLLPTVVAVTQDPAVTIMEE